MAKVQCEDGQAALAQLDHSFPVAGMLLSTSGFFFCDVPSEVEMVRSRKYGLGGHLLSMFL